MVKAPRMRHCFNCGAELGCYPDYEPLDTCGKMKCDREARNAMEAERQEAHDRLDENNGW